MKLILPLVSFALCCGSSAQVAQGAAMIIDSFYPDDFTLSAGGLVRRASLVSSPVGAHRSATISNRLADTEDALHAIFSSADGTLSFFSSDENGGIRPLNVSLSYSQGGPFSLSDYSAFEFNFTHVEGAGSLIIELGSESIYNAETIRVPILASGSVYVPFDQLNFGAGGSIESFYAAHFTFEAASPVFGFTLTEISVVPEPATYGAIIGTAVLFCTALRRRRGPRL